MRPPCSIVIPTWNARDLIVRCLEMLQRETVVDYDEIIVVDDGSRDDTVDILREKFPNVSVISLSENLGFGEACNRGVAHCRHDLVVLLNNDIVSRSDFITPLTRHFEDDDVFAVNPKVFQKDGSTPGGGLVRGYFHAGLLRLRWPEAESDREHQCLTLYANGAATMMNRDKFMNLGGFDPIYYPFYSEDLDLSYRAYQRGWRIVFDPASSVLHDHSVTISGAYSDEYISYVSKRNRIIFILKNIRNPLTLINSIFWLILRFIGSILTYDRTYIKALWAVVRSIPILINRRAETPHRTVKDNEILTMTSQWYQRSSN